MRTFTLIYHTRNVLTRERNSTREWITWWLMIYRNVYNVKIRPPHWSLDVRRLLKYFVYRVYRYIYKASHLYCIYITTNVCTETHVFKQYCCWDIIIIVCVMILLPWRQLTQCILLQKRQRRSVFGFVSLFLSFLMRLSSGNGCQNIGTFCSDILDTGECFFYPCLNFILILFIIILVWVPKSF